MGVPPSRPTSFNLVRILLSTGLGRVVLAVGVLLVIAAISVPAVVFVRLMSPSGPLPADQSQLSQTTIGESIKVVVRIDQRAADGSVSATLLQQTGSQQYRATGQTLQLSLAGDLQVAMGGASDLTTGAIIEAVGVVTSTNATTVHQVTVLTNFVTVSS